MSSIYAPPRSINDIADCYFYHTVDLPNEGTVVGNWDLRSGIGDYLGKIDFSGKRVLDVGCANGVLSFYMEQQGAEVVSYDLDKNGDWDMVPFAKWRDYEHITNMRKSIIDRLNNAYWYSHKLLKSSAKVVYGSVYEIPEEIGDVDVAVYGSILLHLRDPFLALQRGLSLTTETVVIAETLRGQPQKTSEANLGLLPNAKSMEPKDTWWDLRPEWVVQAIGILGFEDVSINYHQQKFEQEVVDLYTVVGKRTSGANKPTYNLESISGAYDTETKGNNTWNWVEHEVEYQFYLSGNAQEAKFKFQFLLSGNPRVLRLEVVNSTGNTIRTFEIPMRGGWGEFESSIIKTDSQDLVIRMSADGEPTQLSAADSRKAKFLIQNLSLQAIS